MAAIGVAAGLFAARAGMRRTPGRRYAGSAEAGPIMPCSFRKATTATGLPAFAESGMEGIAAV
jgi:hypothetical protein